MTNQTNPHLERALDSIVKYSSDKDPIDAPFYKPKLATRGDNIIIQQLNLIIALLADLHKRLDSTASTSQATNTEFLQTIEKSQMTSQK